LEKTQYGAPRAPERAPFRGGVEVSPPHSSLKGQSEGRGAYFVLGSDVREWYVSQVNLVRCSYPPLVRATLSYLAPTASDVVETPKDERTPEEVSSFLKNRYRPKPLQGKKARELRWVTTCLASNPKKTQSHGMPIGRHALPFTSPSTSSPNTMGSDTLALRGRRRSLHEASLSLWLVPFNSLANRGPLVPPPTTSRTL